MTSKIIITTILNICAAILSIKFAIESRKEFVRSKKRLDEIRKINKFIENFKEDKR